MTEAGGGKLGRIGSRAGGRLARSWRAGLRRRAAAGLVPALLVLCVAPGLAAGSFDGIPRVIGSAALPRDPTPHDVDGDGDLDVVYLDGNESSSGVTEIGWFENDGSGGGWLRHVLATGYRGPCSLKLADLDNDGRADLLVALRTAYQVLLFRKLAGAEFAAPTVVRDKLYGLEDVDAADLNNDRRIDLIISSNEGPRWMRQLTGLQFAAPAVIANTYSTFSEPQAVEPHDFDKDGDIDVVVAIAGQDRLFFSRNNGGGSFASPVDLDKPDRPYALDAGDLDGDGHLDIVTAPRDATDARVIWFKNNGNGTFGAKRPLTGTARDVTSVTVADFDRDGDQDIAGAGGGGPVFWFENLGGGTFSAQKNIGDGGDSMFHLTPGDLDGDGDEDLIAAQWASDRFVWYRNTTPIPVIEPPRITRFDAADTSVATSATLTWTTVGATEVEISPGVGVVPASGFRTVALTETRTFTLTARNSVGEASAEVTVVVGEPPLIRSFGAVDDTVARNTQAELRWDVAGAHSLVLEPVPGTVTGSSHQLVLLETTAFRLRASNEFGESSAEATVTVGDPPTISALAAAPATVALNGVSVLNWTATGAATAFVSGGVGQVPVGTAIAVQPGATTTYTVTVSNPFGSASRTVTVNVSGDLFSGECTVAAPYARYTWRPVLADLNGDGKDDLLVVSRSDWASEPAVLRWYPRIRPGAYGSARVIASRSEQAFLAVAHDMDGDGDLDPILAGNGPTQWAANNGGGASFGPLQTLTTLGSHPDYLFVGDLNGDAFPDLASGFWSALRVFPGLPGAQVGPEQFIDDFDGSVNFVEVAHGDFDGDGDLDLVAGKDFDGVISWFENDAGFFANKHPVASGFERLWSMHAGDTDGDGDDDIVVQTWGNEVTVFTNSGGGDFSSVGARTVHSVIDTVYGMDLADFDLDGDLDMVLMGRGIEVQENRGGNVYQLRESHAFPTLLEVRDIAVGDIDDDGDPDVLGADNRGEKICAFINRYRRAAPPVPADPFPAHDLDEDFGESGVALAALFADADTPGSQLGFSIVSSTGAGMFSLATINAAKQLVLQSAPDLFGEARFVIRATDATGLIGTLELAVRVAPVDDPPEARDLAVTGPALVGGTLVAAFTYSDVEGDPAGDPVYQWFRADQPDGTGRADIPGATGPTHVPTPDDLGRFVGFEVTPVAAAGLTPVGSAQVSTAVGPVEKAPTTLTITSDLPDPSFVNAPVELQFALAFDSAIIAGAPTGTITLSAPGGVVLSLPVTATSGTVALPVAGTQQVTVAYSGDDSFAPTSSVVEHVVHSQVCITAAAATIAEDAAGTADFVVSRDGDTDAPLAVQLAIGGTAVRDADYSLGGAIAGATVTIPAGAASTTLALDPAADVTVELDENVTLTLVAGANYSVLPAAPAAATAIVNDDAAVLAITPATATETDHGNAQLSFAIALSQPVDVPVTIGLATSPLSAAAGDDFVPSAVDPPFAVGPTTDPVVWTVEVLPDNLDEADETLELTAHTLDAAGRNVVLAGGGATTSATGTIIDEDFAPVAQPDGPFEVVEDGAIDVPPQAGVLANDTDQDDGDGPASLTAVLHQDAGHGTLTLNPDGSFTYQPDRDFFGADFFTCAASDGTNSSAPVRVDIVVTEQVDLVLTAAGDREVVGAPGTTTHTLTLHNLGPSNATSVVVDLAHVTPAGVTRDPAVVSAGAVANDQWRLDLAEGCDATLQVTCHVAADAAGAINAISTAGSVRSADQPLVRPEDDSAAVACSIISPADTGVLGLDPTPILSRQSGLFRQRVTITNHNPLPMAGFRLLIGGLPADVQVFNAHGVTPDGVAFIDCDNDLPPGAAVTLTVEFFRPSLDPRFEPAYSIAAVFAEDPRQPAAGDAGAAAERVQVLADGDFLIEFASTPGTAYAIEYSHDMTIWHRVSPVITANANRTQWIDSGPPKTVSPPATVARRYYRIATLPN